MDIWSTKYCLKAKNGSPVDKDIDATYTRVARALAETEVTPALQEGVGEKFLWALRHGAIPAVALYPTPARVSTNHPPRLSTARFRHHSRLHERNPGKGARGRSHAQGRLRHRLQFSTPAPQGCMRQRRRCLHFRAAVVHGYL